MMTWLFVLFVVALAIAPLLQFAPSKRQRAQASLREAAALAGLYVEFRDLPLPPPRRERLSVSERQVLYYGLRLPSSKGQARVAQVWWRDGDEWRGSPERGSPPASVSLLPGWVLAASVDEASCGVYWREAGGVEAVETIAAALKEWRDA